MERVSNVTNPEDITNSNKTLNTNQSESFEDLSNENELKCNSCYKIFERKHDLNLHKSKTRWCGSVES